MATPEQRPIIDVTRLLAASKKYSALLRRTIVSQSIMSSALQIPKASDALKEVVLYKHQSGLTGLQSLVREMTPTEAVDPVRDFDKIAEVLAQQAAVNGENLIAAFVVVLSHATADDVLTGACELAMDLDPGGWIPDLNMERKVSLATILEKGASGVFASELEKLRQQLSGKALPNRAEQFFRHVKIRHHPMFDPADFRYFRVSRLKEADELRNRIVHGSGLPEIDLELATQTMLFLHEAATTAMRSLASAYRLPIEWSILLGNRTEETG